MEGRLNSVATATLITLCLLVPTAAKAQTDTLNADDMALQYAEQVPGYGGMFVDPEGVTHIYLTDMSRMTDIQLDSVEEVRFLPGKFAFDELYAYRGQMVEVMNDPDVVYLDIDEQTNRVTVGVSTEALQKRSGTEIARHFNVPEGAVVVKEVEPIYQLVGLRDRRRPAPAGMQINFPGFVCTLGFVVRQGGTNGFVTNSHCTSTQGGVENTPYWQPSQSGSNAFGTEIRDPNYQFGGPVAQPGAAAGRVIVPLCGSVATTPGSVNSVESRVQPALTAAA